MTPNQHSDLLAHVRASLDSEFEPDWEDAAEVYKAYASLVEQLEAAQPLDRSTWREGMVTVYDHEGEYVGCMGRESWDWLLEQGYEKCRVAVEQYESLKEQLDGTGKAAVREARRSADFLARAENAERKWAVERDRANGLQEQLEVARKALVDIENLLPVDNDPYDGSANRPIREAVERGLDSYPASEPREGT